MPPKKELEPSDVHKFDPKDKDNFPLARDFVPTKEQKLPDAKGVVVDQITPAEMEALKEPNKLPDGYLTKQRRRDGL